MKLNQIWGYKESKMKLKSLAVVFIIGLLFVGCTKTRHIPIEILEEVKPNKIVKNIEIIIDNVQFDFDRDNIKEYWVGVMLINYLKFEANNSYIMIEGHTDSRGSEEYNYDLGLRRSISAKNHLVNLGMYEGQIQITTLGETELLTKGTTEEDHTLNRRVVFKILNKD